jgi:hypothetical protein
MSSLPLYWPLGVELAELAGGLDAVPWQREALEQSYRLQLLDTLSPAPALGAQGSSPDPLAGLSRLAIIQPRGLSPADNVALDQWVRSGGRLLLVLDPQLTGDYDLPLGDPRRPSDTAIIPAVVAHWGLAVLFDEAQDADWRAAKLDGAIVPLRLAGELSVSETGKGLCALYTKGAAAHCRIGKGRVTVLADAALFEHRAAAGERAARLTALLAATLD